MQAGPILHLDLDAFYAAVAQRDNPRLQGSPIAVGGGVVLAASYEAREYGVRSAMTIREARLLCPQLEVVSGDFSSIVEASEEVFDVCRDVTPRVEQISIDEAFIDVSGATHLFGPAPSIAKRLRRQVRARTQLPASVGVASTKFLAKVASRRAKPDGLVVVPKESELDFLHRLPVDHIWGVGPTTEARLAGYGISTIGELAAIPVESLQASLGGYAGRHLHALAWNHDRRVVESGHRAGSVGAQSALGRNTMSREDLKTVLLRLADRVGGRLRAKERAGRTITLRVRYEDMDRATRSTTLKEPTASNAAIHQTVLALLDRCVGPDEHVTLLGISVSNLVQGAPQQAELPLEGVDSLQMPDRESLDRSLDELRERYGRSIVRPASFDPGREHWLTKLPRGD